MSAQTTSARKTSHGLSLSGLASTPLLSVVLGFSLALFLVFPSGAHAATVRIATLDWPPYVTVQGPEGLLQVIVSQALARAGHSVKYVFLPWKRAIQAARNNDVDAYFPEYPYPEIQDANYVSDPLPAGALVLMARNATRIRFHSLDDLKPYRIGVVDGYVNTAAFDARSDLIKDAATSDAVNLAKLAAGRVDVILIDEYVGRYLHKDHSEPMRIVAALESKRLVVCFPRGNPDAARFQADLNTGLRQLAADGFIVRTLKQFGLPLR